MIQVGPQLAQRKRRYHLPQNIEIEFGGTSCLHKHIVWFISKFVISLVACLHPSRMEIVICLNDIHSSGVPERADRKSVLRTLIKFLFRGSRSKVAFVNEVPIVAHWAPYKTGNIVIACQICTEMIWIEERLNNVMSYVMFDKTCNEISHWMKKKRKHSNGQSLINTYLIIINSLINISLIIK